LQSALGCFVRPDGNRLLRAYLKCTSWTVLIAGTMAECTPSVPGVFIHRDPLLVLASIHRAAPGWAQSGSDLAARFGIVSSADPLEQAVHFLAAFLRSALDAEAHGILKLVAYPNILDRFINGDLPAYFGYEVDEATRVRMIAAAKYHSKEPGRRREPHWVAKSTDSLANPKTHRVRYPPMYPHRTILRARAAAGYEYRKFKPRICRNVRYWKLCVGSWTAHQQQLLC